ncbi:MAG: DUF1223 domain-containing protein [Litoreibacter sp.]|nr:DUF1223 domain-containing protein [Litoreibacter sp.]
MMRKLLTHALAGFLALAPLEGARADVVVELYTSQGCSSCPPADALLEQLAARDDVIALSLHVDYWDYLGWQDAFANPAFTKRQRGYAARAGSSMIYTPQMVIGGRDHIVGTKGMELSDLIAKHSAQAAPVTLTLDRAENRLRVGADISAPPTGELAVFLVHYSPSETVKIKRGENAGRELTYHNVVTNWTLLTTWDGAEPLALETELASENPGVVIVQDGRVGPVLAAQKID